MWNEIGEKREPEKKIIKITWIDSDVRRNYELLFIKSIARRMSWAPE